MFQVQTARLFLVPLTVEQMQLMMDDYQQLEDRLGLPRTDQRLARRLYPVLTHNLSFIRNDPENEIWYTYWVLIDKTETRIVGGLGFKGPGDERGVVEIGYGVNDSDRNRGYMTEAVTAMVGWATAQNGVHGVRAETANTNLASIRVVQKVGFVPYRATDRFLYWRMDRARWEYLYALPPETESGQFALFDLRVMVERIDGNCTCDMTVGDAFFLRRSSSLSLPAGGHFCIWALNSVVPLLSAKQRHNHPADWIETDSRVTCPDPACGLIMRIDRLPATLLRHDDVSPIPWESVDKSDTQR